MNNELVITWDQVLEDGRWLAQRLLTLGKQYKAIVAIARGGLVPAAILAREMDIRHVEVICARSYEDDVQTGVGKPRGVSLSMGSPDYIASIGKEVIVVDDLADTGATFKAVKEFLPEATYACLYAKNMGQSATDFFAKGYPQSTWLHFPWDVQLRFEPAMKDKIGVNPQED